MAGVVVVAVVCVVVLLVPLLLPTYSALGTPPSGNPAAGQWQITLRFPGSSLPDQAHTLTLLADGPRPSGRWAR